MLVFIDESGHPRPTDPTTHPTILGVCVEESKLGQLSRATFALKRSLLSQLSLNKKEREGKAAELLNRRALTQNAAKREFAEAFFDRLRDFPLHVFAVVAERPTKPPYEGPEVLQAHHRYLLERVELHMKQDHLKERGYLAEDDDLVFLSPTGGHIDSWALRRRFYRAIKKAGLRRIRIHDLRHTFGTTGARVLSLSDLQHYMGHAHAVTTARYIHHQPRPEDAAKLADAFRVPNGVPNGAGSTRTERNSGVENPL